MIAFHLLPTRPGTRRRASRFAHGFTLIEVMISVAVLALGTMGGIASMMTLNRYAANLRNLSEARSLCQERIEQALTLRFLPPSGNVPMAPNSDPVTVTTSANLPILGAASYYNTTTSAYTGLSNFQTSTETIPVAMQSDGTSTNGIASTGSACVIYTRTTSVSPAGLMYATPTATTTTSLNVMQFTVTVSYVFYGQTYTTSMSTLRGPN